MSVKITTQEALDHVLLLSQRLAYLDTMLTPLEKAVYAAEDLLAEAEHESDCPLTEDDLDIARGVLSHAELRRWRVSTQMATIRDKIKHTRATGLIGN
jgi:hypothetical protein